LFLATHFARPYLNSFKEQNNNKNNKHDLFCFLYRCTQNRAYSTSQVPKTKDDLPIKQQNAY
jgi:hypothetical protein